MIKGIAAGDSMQSSSTDINRYLNDYHSLGANWIRFDFDWAYIQADGPTSYNWAANDAAVASAQARGIKVLGIIAYVPQWALPSGCTDSYRCAPKNASDFAAFAAKVAARYAPMGVHTWEIWNEPNLSGKFTAPTYTALLQATYTAIKQVDPTAFILNGGLGPPVTNGTDISPCDFLAGSYRVVAKALLRPLRTIPTASMLALISVLPRLVSLVPDARHAYKPQEHHDSQWRPKQADLGY